MRVLGESFAVLARRLRDAGGAARAQRALDRVHVRARRRRAGLARLPPAAPPAALERPRAAAARGRRVPRLRSRSTRGIVDTIAIANGGCISALLIAGAAFASAWLYARNGANAQLASLLYLWGLAWWLGAGLREIDRFVPPHLHPQALLGFVALTRGLAGARLAPGATRALAWTAAIALAAGIALVFCLRRRRRAAVRRLGTRSIRRVCARRLPDAARTSRRARRRARASRISAGSGRGRSRSRSRCASSRATPQLAAGWRDALTLLPLLAAWMLALLRPAWIAPPLDRALRRAGARSSSARRRSSRSRHLPSCCCTPATRRRCRTFRC